MNRDPQGGVAVSNTPTPATQAAIQQLAGALVADTRFLTDGYRLLLGAITQVRCLQWPAEQRPGFVFMPTLRLETPAARLRRYTRHVPDMMAMEGEDSKGCWLNLEAAYGPAPASDAFDLARRHRPVIGTVDVDSYVRYLGIYRTIVESNASAISKIVAINGLGERSSFSMFSKRHCELDPLFPLSRFHLTIDLLSGVGAKTRQQLTAHGLNSIPAVAAADEAALVQVNNHLKKK